mmetsp:Transcript_41841/g.79955  ORF Transcript_41841/g.79955 Transcript_41841/m.79955 type:complete len:205 (+) Transcript_41841:842-1456(+)
MRCRRAQPVCCQAPLPARGRVPNGQLSGRRGRGARVSRRAPHQLVCAAQRHGAGAPRPAGVLPHGVVGGRVSAALLHAPRRPQHRGLLREQQQPHLLRVRSAERGHRKPEVRLLGSPVGGSHHVRGVRRAIDAGREHDRGGARVQRCKHVLAQLRVCARVRGQRESVCVVRGDFGGRGCVHRRRDGFVQGSRRAPSVAGLRTDR